jgi:formylglycine-generating enzyme required for sulfatase activity
MDTIHPKHGHSRILAVLMAITLAASAPAQSCAGDLNDDGVINGADLGQLLAVWGPCQSCEADLSANGVVDGADLGVQLGNWGECVTIPTWAMVVQAQPDPAVVTDAALRTAIVATGRPWRVRDTATQVEMLLVPPGTFQMGCILGSAQHGCMAAEQPVHHVTLTTPFYLGRYEVTQLQWQSQMGNNPSFFDNASTQVPESQVPNRPVEIVSWTEIQGYLSATGFRLPTEAEWEYACRAGTQTPFHSGPGFPNGTNDDSLVSQVAWYAPNSGGQTRPVGVKAANAFGFHDMLGNVWEWVNDWYGGYSADAQANPTGPVSASKCVIRGGSWVAIEGSLFVRSSYRNSLTPGSRNANIGFRVARTP